MPIPKGITIKRLPEGPENVHFQWHQWDSELGEYGEHLKQEEAAEKAPGRALLASSIGAAIDDAAIYLVEDIEDFE